MGTCLASQPVGYLLGNFGLLAMLVCLLLAAWFGQVVIVILLGLILSAAGLSKLWSRFSLAGVTCQRQLSERRIFPGECIELRLRLVNRKLLPLPWIQADDEMPLKFCVDVPLSFSSPFCKGRRASPLEGILLICRGVLEGRKPLFSILPPLL